MKIRACLGRVILPLPLAVALVIGPSMTWGQALTGSIVGTAAAGVVSSADSARTIQMALKLTF